MLGVLHARFACLDGRASPSPARTCAEGFPVPQGRLTPRRKENRLRQHRPPLPLPFFFITQSPSVHLAVQIQCRTDPLLPAGCPVILSACPRRAWVFHRLPACEGCGMSGLRPSVYLIRPNRPAYDWLGLRHAQWGGAVRLSN